MRVADAVLFQKARTTSESVHEKVFATDPPIAATRGIPRNPCQ
jgi:hypothetical protein